MRGEGYAVELEGGFRCVERVVVVQEDVGK